VQQPVLTAERVRRLLAERGFAVGEVLVFDDLREFHIGGGNAEFGLFATFDISSRLGASLGISGSCFP
jgi:hypothetical protein